MLNMSYCCAGSTARVARSYTAMACRARPHSSSSCAYSRYRAVARVVEGRAGQTPVPPPHHPTPPPQPHAHHPATPAPPHHPTTPAPCPSSFLTLGMFGRAAVQRLFEEVPGPLQLAAPVAGDELGQVGAPDVGHVGPLEERDAALVGLSRGEGRVGVSECPGGGAESRSESGETGPMPPPPTWHPQQAPPRTARTRRAQRPAPSGQHYRDRWAWAWAAPALPKIHTHPRHGAAATRGCTNDHPHGRVQMPPHIQPLCSRRRPPTAQQVRDPLLLASCTHRTQCSPRAGVFEEAAWGRQGPWDGFLPP